MKTGDIDVANYPIGLLRGLEDALQVEAFDQWILFMQVDTPTAAFMRRRRYKSEAQGLAAAKETLLRTAREFSRYLESSGLVPELSGAIRREINYRARLADNGRDWDVFMRVRTLDAERQSRV